MHICYKEGGESMKGIDVSIFQGEVDWLSVRNAGIEFALIKCSQGGFTNSSAISPFTDRYFKRNIVGASDAGPALRRVPSSDGRDG